MAKFTSATQQIPGAGIGDQRTVNVPDPNINQAIQQTGSLVNSVADVVGNIYASGKASQIVNQSEQTVDSTIGQLQASNLNTQPDLHQATVPTPKSVQMAEDTFNSLQNAVDNGTLSREKAKMYTASLVRQHIADQPLFATQIRKAAGSLLGFDPYSEQAQSYFQAFPTEAQLHPTGKTALQKLEESAQAASVATGIPFKDALHLFGQASVAEQKAKIVDLQTKAGLKDSGTWLSDTDAALSTSQFDGTMGVILALKKANNGKVDPQEVKQRVMELKQVYINKMKQGFTSHGGTISSQDWKQFLSQTEQRFKDYEDYTDFVGVDHLNQLNIQRAKAAQEIWGNTYLAQIKTLNTNVGAQVTGQLLDLFSKVTDPSQLKVLFTAFPQLKTVYDTINNPDLFKQQLGNTAQAVITGGKLTEDQKKVVDPVVSMLTKNGDAETTSKVVQTLAHNGYVAKPISILASKAPTWTTEQDRTYFKNSYKTDLPQVINSVAEDLSSYPNAVISWDGDKFVANQTAPTGVKQPLVQPDKINVATNINANRLNSYLDALNNGWDKLVGESPIAYKNRVLNEINAKRQEFETANTLNTAKQIGGLYRNGNEAKADEILINTVQANPKAYPMGWQKLKQMIIDKQNSLNQQENKQ